MNTKTKTWIVYLITNTINGKYYVGWTATAFDVRWETHVFDAFHKSNLYFHKAIRKYGLDAFEYQILTTVLTGNEAKELERLWIRVLCSYNPEVGYNMTLGGDGFVGTEEQIAARTAKWRNTLGPRIVDNAARLLEGYKRYIENRTEEELQNYKDLKRTQSTEFWENLSIERYEQMCIASSKQVTQIWANRSEEERTRINKKNSDSNKRTAAARTKEEQEELNKKTGAGVRQYNAAHPEGRLKVAACLRNKIWITDGVNDFRIPESTEIPVGCRKGRAKLKTSGTIWITNGIDNKRVAPYSVLSEGWNRGHTNFKIRKDLKDAA